MGSMTKPISAIPDDRATRPQPDGLRLTLHRGAHEIGGTCLELATPTTRILLDIGMPLMGPGGTPVDEEQLLPAVAGLYPGDPRPAPDAVLISHAHQDHYGLVDRIRPDIPVYVSNPSRKLIALTRLFQGKENPSVPHTMPFRSYQPFTIGDMRITPYLVDHSAFDAHAFLIEGGGQKYIYSGDLRMHGRKPGAMEGFLRHAPKGVDGLLLEGTTLGRQAAPGSALPRTETDLEEAAVQHFRETPGLVLLQCSAQNIDRLVTAYRACLRSGRTLVVDVYTAHVLADLAEDGACLPRVDRRWDVGVIYPRRLTRRIFNHMDPALAWRFARSGRKVEWRALDASPDKYVLLVRDSMQVDLETLALPRGARLLYSLWGGYKEQPGTAAFHTYLRARDVEMADLHVSGHAYPEDLQAIVQRLAPRALIPIHTMEGDRYADIFAGTPVRRIENGGWL